MSIFVNILTGLLVLLSLFLIFVVTIQTSKSEGFGGVQNAPTGAFRGKAGYDEMLSLYTRYIAMAWFGTAFLIAVLAEVARH